MRYIFIIAYVNWKLRLKSVLTFKILYFFQYFTKPLYAEDESMFGFKGLEVCGSDDWLIIEQFTRPALLAWWANKKKHTEQIKLKHKTCQKLFAKALLLWNFGTVNKGIIREVNLGCWIALVESAH